MLKYAYFSFENVKITKLIVSLCIFMYNYVERSETMIKWFDAKERNGTASLYVNNITLNTTAMYPLDCAFRVIVGVRDDNNIVIKPVSKNEVESGTLDESRLLKLETHKSFARISSSILMRQIAEELKIELSKNAIKFETTWDDNENVLVINIKGGRK